VSEGGMISAGAVSDLGKAIDIYLGELARGSCTRETLRTYLRILNLFADRFEAKLINQITVRDCRSFLDRWSTASPATQAQYVSILRGFFAFLVEEGAITETPMGKIKRPRRLPPEETEVVSISSQQARRVLEACEDWQEVLCVATALYLGARRAALSRVRRRDVDLEVGTIRFLEKGRKVAVKPIPDEYLGRPPCGRRRRDLGLLGGLLDPEPSPSGRTPPRTLRQDHLGDGPSGCGAGGNPSSCARAPFGIRCPIHRHPPRRGARASEPDGPHANGDDGASLPAPSRQGAGNGVRARPHLVTVPATTESTGGAYGIRTRATAVRGRRPRPLDECARRGTG
jgi:hypothetical protein